MRCGVGSNGLIDVMALDMTSGKMARTEIHRSSGLSDEEIAREAGGCAGCAFSESSINRVNNPAPTRRRRWASAT